MQRRSFRLVAVALVVALGLVAASASVWVALERSPRVEILVRDVALLADRPEARMTELRLDLVLRNPGASPARIDTIVLTAFEPEAGTLFDTFVHSDLTIEPSSTRVFTEAAETSGAWSQVAFSVRIFQDGGPRWEASIEPDTPVTWRQG